MGNILKIVIAGVVGLGVGLGAGYLLGRTGQGALKAEITRLGKSGAAAGAAHTAKMEQCKRRLNKAKAGRSLLKGQEYLLRALLELDSRNFGLASQHLGSASEQLKKASKSSQRPKITASLDALQPRLAKVQTEVMKLKPGSRAEITKILTELGRFPGNR